MSTVNKLVRDGRTFSGNERNCCFLNVGAQAFANVSGVSGADFADDGRAVAVVDWDQDGDLDLWVSNRTSPAIRFLRNNLGHRHGFIRIRLQGTGRSNRDAIGARVELTLPDQRLGKMVKTLRAGDGFLGDSSKWLHFGIGQSTSIERLVINWPDGQSETIQGLRPNRHYLVTQGEGRATRWSRPQAELKLTPSSNERPSELGIARIVLSRPIDLPQCRYRDREGNTVPISGRGRPQLVSLWAKWCPSCVAELAEISENTSRFESAGVDVVALSVDRATDEATAYDLEADALLDRMEFPFSRGQAMAETLATLDVLQRAVLSLQRPLPLPSSFLIDRNDRLLVIYKGRTSVEQIVADAESLDSRALSPDASVTPLRGHWLVRPKPLDAMAVAMKMLEAGEHEQARRYLKQDVERSLRRNGPNAQSLADTYHALGTILVEEGKSDQAQSMFLDGLRADPNHWDTRFDLGILHFKSGEFGKAHEQFTEALRIRPHDADMLNKLGLVSMNQGKLREAADFLNQSLKLDPQNVTTLYNLGLVMSRNGRFMEAATYFGAVVELDEQNYRARSKLAIMQLRMGDAMEAIENFQQAMELEPLDAQGHFHLGNALKAVQRNREALAHFKEALVLRPNWDVAANNAAWILATHKDEDVRDSQMAIHWATMACQQTRYLQPVPLDTLATAHAAAGDFPTAIQFAERAAERARDLNQRTLEAKIRERLGLFGFNQPYVE